MLSDAVARMMPAALAMLTSPLAIAAMIVMLLSRRARVYAGGFAIGWFTSVLGAVLLAALVGAGLLFAGIASVGVLAPFVLYLGLGPRGPVVLAALRGWLVRHDRVVVAAVLAAVGVQQLGSGAGWW
jgi:hypothetical protein